MVELTIVSYLLLDCSYFLETLPADDEMLNRMDVYQLMMLMIPVVVSNLLKVSVFS